MTTEAKLRGLDILIIEDDWLQARELSECLLLAGAQVVGPTGSAEEVIDLCRRQRLDAAVVDINLGLGADFNVAQWLMQSNVPFLFLTGYDSSMIPNQFLSVPKLQKPASEKDIIEALRQLAIPI